MTQYRLAAGVVVLVLVVGVVVMRTVANDTPMDKARAALRDDDDFTRASDAGVAFTRISEHLEDAATDCGSEKPECAEFYTAAAFARVGAVGVLRCGRPQIFAFRSDFAGYLSRVAADKAATPPAVAC